MSGLLRRLRAEPDRWLILVTTLAWASLLVVYSVLTPVWRSPDEASHFDLVLDVADGRGYADWDTDRLSEGVLDASAPVRTAPPRAPIEPRARPPALPPVEDSSDQSTAANHMTQHPPAYYWTVGAVLALAQEVGLAPPSVSGQLAVARVLSAILLVPVPSLAWAVARLLGGGPGVRRLALVAPLAVPGLAQVGSGVTNDVLSVLLFSALAVVLAAYVRGRRSLGVCVGAGALCGAALFTKAFGAAAVPWALLVVLASWRMGERDRVLRHSLAITAVAFVTGGWWYLRNLVRDGRLLPSIEEARFSSQSPLAGADKSLGEWLHRFTPVAGRGFFGLFGYADVAISDRVYHAALALGIVGVVAGLVAVRRSRPELVLLAAPLPLLLALQASQSFRLYERSGVVALGHGRYLMPAIVPVVVLIALGVARPSWPGGWRAAPVALMVAVAAHLHAASRLLDFYWADGGGMDAVRVATAWSPLPHAMAMGAFMATGALLLLLLVLLLRDPDRRAATAAGTPTPIGAARRGAPRPAPVARGTTLPSP